MQDSTTMSPMQTLQAISPEAAKTYMDIRNATMDNPAFQAVPLKYKLLIGIGAAAVLQSETCTLMWAKQARQAGVSDDEIVEAILVARLMKMATVTDTVSAALAWLKATPQT